MKYIKHSLPLLLYIIIQLKIIELLYCNMDTLLRLQQRLTIALHDFIVRCNGNYILFNLELDRLMIKYKNNNSLTLIKSNLLFMKNNNVDVTTFITQCKIEEMTDIEIVKELLSFVDFLFVERLMTLVDKVNDLEERLYHLEK
jgi:hypothetical protein